MKFIGQGSATFVKLLSQKTGTFLEVFSLQI